MKIYAFLLLLVTAFYAETEEKISARAEDSLQRVRYIRYNQWYSLALTGVHDSLMNSYQYSFSFYSDRIKAGRLKPSGIWRELFHPFSYRAESLVYREETGAEKDFENSTGGVQGISILLPFETSLTCILQPELWAGSMTTIKVSDQLSFHVLFRADEKKAFASDEWRNDYPDTAISEPFYSGMEVQSIFNFLSMKTLFVLSGNPYFRSGLLVRNVIQAFLFPWEISVLEVYADKDFMLPSGKLEKGHLLSSGTVTFFPLKWFSITVDGKYRIDKKPAYPVFFTGSMFHGGICIQFGKDPFLLTVKGADAAVFNPSGSADTCYSVEGSVKAAEGPFSGKLLFAEKGEEGHPFRRKGTLSLSGKTSAFLLSVTVSLIKDIHTSPLLCLEGGVAAEMYTQNAVISFSFRKSAHTGEMHYSIGFDTTI